MRIAILGAGKLGTALGRGLASAGHTIVFGVRDAAAASPELAAFAEVAGVRDAAADLELLVLATPAAAAFDAVREAGLLRVGAIVVDATNPVGPGLRLLTGENGESHAERIEALLLTTSPGARLVKSFNQTGANVVAVATTFSPRGVMAVAGDDPDANAVVASLAESIGFEAVQAGPLHRARELERVAMLWIALSASPATGLGRDFVFALVRR